MRVQLAKWGNSVGLRVPQAILKQLDLRAGGQVDMAISPDGVIQLRPIKRSPKELLAEMVEQARALGRDYEPETVDWGPDRGSEIIDDEYSRGEITLEDVLRRRDARRG